jgi:DNA (cytosine-5)-methyltransferase 1
MIPDHDVLLAGFPCQPFSRAGISNRKFLKRSHGFDDKDQGDLFFNILNILKIKKPKAFHFRECSKSKDLPKW